MKTEPLRWLGNRLQILDQTRLPQEESYLELGGYREIAAAIRDLKVRGAPVIGIAGAYAIALGAQEIKDGFDHRLEGIIGAIAATRPTARNLFRTIERMRRIAAAGNSPERTKKALIQEAVKIHAEETEATNRLCRLGAELIEEGSTVLTHCNTGPLATTGYGTAAGIIIRTWEHGKKVKALVTETRPLLQGARLTTWELSKAGVPATLITDSMAGYFMWRGEVNCVITGADRIAANGDTANKIGTYTLAVLACAHKIPFYIAAPTSTIDPSIFTGREITIEQRGPKEVTSLQGRPIAPEGIAAANPAFDITPQRYITAIITEKGIIRKPFYEGIKGILPR